MRTRVLTLIAVVCLPLTLAGASPPSRANGVAEGIENRGCYLNVMAKNSGDRSILIDIRNSRIKLVAAPYWSRITRTSNQNIRAGQTRQFGVWAQRCGAGSFHMIRLLLRRGTETKTIYFQHVNMRNASCGPRTFCYVGDLAESFN